MKKLEAYGTLSRKDFLRKKLRSVNVAENDKHCQGLVLEFEEGKLFIPIKDICPSLCLTCNEKETPCQP